MTRSWSDIEAFYRRLEPQFKDVSFRQAFAAVEDLASHIANGKLASMLFGWTSMHDLCVQQTDVEPRSGPFIRISPQTDGRVLFLYEDTAIEDRQWSRSVPPEGVIGRFEAFLDQLHWIAH